MAEKKKIFNESDFDKDKQLFTSADFEKEKDLEINPNVPNPKQEKKSNTGKIVGGIAAVAAILAGVYFFGINGNDSVVDNGGVPTEQIAQAGKTAQPEAEQLSDATEDATPGKEAAANNDAETPAPVEANKAPASGSNAKATTPAPADEKQANPPSPNESHVIKPSRPSQSKQNNVLTINVVSASSPISDDVVENAKRVIRGDFGNGKERKDKLGSAYTEIQSKVNEMYRQGLVR